MNYPGVMIAGTNSGCGKSTITLGLLLALKNAGLIVSAFKTGPDYIDPSYHSFVLGKPCRNLDTWLLSKGAILELFERQAKVSDISIVEGVMGLYDGLGRCESGSSGHLAKMLGLPVILVVNVDSLSTSAGAVVLGYKEFDKTVNLRGVILNNIAGVWHYASVKEAIEKKTGLPVLGFLPRDKSLSLPQRHLGLIPAQEKAVFKNFTDKLLSLVKENIEIDKIIAISRCAKGLPAFKPRLFLKKAALDRISIAIAKDAAFNFYYQDNLEILNQKGADLIEFSPLRDKILPKGADAVYIGGGFPELFARRLAKNTALKNDIRLKAASGMPVYAECGGLMYLMDAIIDFRNKRFPMVGIFKGLAKMANKHQALGYIEVETLNDNVLSKKGEKTRAHAFHWSYLEAFPKNTIFAYRISKAGLKNNGERRARGEIQYDGLINKNVLASYAHLHFASNPNFAKNFVNICRRYRNANS